MSASIVVRRWVPAAGGPLFRAVLDGETVLPVRAFLRKGRTFSWKDGFGRTGSDDLTLWVPVGSSVRLRTMSGDITVGAGMDIVNAYALSGDVRVTGVREAARIRTVSGSISLRGAKKARLKSVSGKIRVSDITAQVMISCISGDILAQKIEGQQLRASVVNGSIFARKIRSRRVFLRSVRGDVDVDFEASHQQSIQARAKSNMGNVRAHIAKGLTVSLRASAGRGKLSLFGQAVRSPLIQSIQGGSSSLPVLTLRLSSLFGDVLVITQKTQKP